METAARNPQLWYLARQRAKFQAGLVTFLFVNAILWAVWALTGREANPIPWPLWVTFFWGIGMVARGLKAYAGLNCTDRTEREYEKLVREQRNEQR